MRQLAPALLTLTLLMGTIGCTTNSGQDDSKSPKAPNQLTYLQEQKQKAASGDVKAMYLVGMLYQELKNLHLEISYMWLSIAMENADPKLKAEIKEYLDALVIPKLGDSGIAHAKKRMQRCKESNYIDCADTSFKIYQRN